MKIYARHTTALRSAVDLLTNCVSPDYADQVLGDYRCGGKRHALAVSLYDLVAALERGEQIQYSDPF